MIGLLLLFSTAEAYVKVPIKAVSGPKTQKLSPEIGSHESSLLTASVENAFNLQYNAVFNVGTPSQPMSMVLDTGSSYIWLPSTTCDCHESTRFDDSLSTSYISTGISKDLYYGLGEVHGMLSTETIEIDGLTVNEQYFVLTTSDYDLDSLASDGLLGLGFDSLSDYYPTFIQTLKDQNVIDNTVFAMYLNNLDDPYMESAFTIGGYDEDMYATGNEKNINIDTTYGFWGTYVEKVIVGGKAKKHEAYAILDTGTSLIAGPDAEIDLIKKKISDKVEGCYDYSYVICDCVQGEYEDFPDVVFVIEGENYKITPESYIYYEAGYCYALFDYTYDSYWIIGQPFFRQYYVAHDMDNKLARVWTAKTTQNSEKLVADTVIGNSAAAGLILGTVALSIYFFKRTQADPLSYSQL